MDAIPIPAAQTGTQLCPQCHLPQPQEFYFCPNCGAKLRVPPLSTAPSQQILLYLFSAVLPWIAYIAITKWDGIKYLRSSDERARTIGYVALGILTVSSIVMFWLSIVWINQTISAAMTDVNNIGNFGSGL